MNETRKIKNKKTKNSKKEKERKDLLIGFQSDGFAFPEALIEWIPTAAHLFLPYLLAFISPEHSSIPSGGSYDSDGHFVLRWMKKQQHPLHSPNWIRIFIIYVLNYLRTRQTQ